MIDRVFLLHCWCAEHMHCSFISDLCCMYLKSSGNGLCILSKPYNFVHVEAKTTSRQLQDPTVNDSPHPQASFTFGFLNANRALSGDKGKDAGRDACDLPQGILPPIHLASND